MRSDGKFPRERASEEDEVREVECRRVLAVDSFKERFQRVCKTRPDSPGSIDSRLTCE